MSFALRNPLKIAECAQQVVQDGAINLAVDSGVLRRPIEIQRDTTNIVDGQLIKVDNPNLSFEEALEATFLKIPHGQHALIFVDDTCITENAREAIENFFAHR